MKSNARKISVSIAIILLVVLSTSLISTVSAQYYPLSQCHLFTSVNYPGAGNVYPSGSNMLYYYGSTVTVSEYTNPGFVFDGWYVNGIYQGRLSTLTLTMTQDYTVYAVFSMRTISITILANPSDGGTTVPAAGIWNYSSGTAPVTITEYPATGNTFAGWYLDGTYQGLGTSITLNTTQDHQLSAFFSGSSSIPTPAPTPTPIPTPTPTPNPNLQTPSLSFFCSSTSSATGFSVAIKGALVINQTGMSGTGVAFSYSATGGATWHDLAYVITADYGNFSAVWYPTASGNYLVKGMWYSDGIYSTVSQTVQFAVTPYTNQNQIFSVTSNSTLSSLTFDSSTSKLAFSVSGPSGTSGYVQACIPKTLLASASTLKVALDGIDVPFSTYSQGDTWIITIEYSHSSHQVIMTLDTIVATSTPTQSPTANPTTSPTQTSNPTQNPTASANPTINPTATTTNNSATPTQTVPELEPLLVLPLLVLMISLATFIALKKQKHKNSTHD